MVYLLHRQTGEAFHIIDRTDQTIIVGKDQRSTIEFQRCELTWITPGVFNTPTILHFPGRRVRIERKSDQSHLDDLWRDLLQESRQRSDPGDEMPSNSFEFVLSPFWREVFPFIGIPLVYILISYLTGTAGFISLEIMLLFFAPAAWILVQWRRSLLKSNLGLCDIFILRCKDGSVSIVFPFQARGQTLLRGRDAARISIRKFGINDHRITLPAIRITTESGEPMHIPLTNRRLLPIIRHLGSWIPEDNSQSRMADDDT